MEIKDAVFVITGSSSGIGRALAENLIKKGAKLAISSRSKEKAEKTAGELGVPFFVADVKEMEQMEALGNFTEQTFGPINCWINNAGIWIPYADAKDIPVHKYHDLIDVNLFGVIHGSKIAIEHMKERREGTIVNIASVRSLKGKAGASAYCASKFAVKGFTESIREELRDIGIRVIEVHPNRTKTNIFGDHKHEDYGQSMNPEDVAAKIVDNLEKEDPEEEIMVKKD